MNQRASKRRDRYLIIVADDLGRSSFVNRAIARAFDRGLLTGASLMAGGDAFEEAVTLARIRPRLSVGLHVTLCDGRAVLPPHEIPDLADTNGWFLKSPFRAGLHYWRLRRRLAGQIEAEIEAQFERLQEAGISPTHVDGHHHLHMHPVIFETLCRAAAKRRVAWIRVPRESLMVVACTGKPFVIPRLAEWITFRMLAIRNIKIASEHGLKIASSVVGLPRTGRRGTISKVNEKYFGALLPLLTGITNEIYAHPDLATEAGRRETEALVSVDIRRGAASLGLACTGYSELLGAIGAEDRQEMRR
jgi:chitin disaccharide deacetylase